MTNSHTSSTRLIVDPASAQHKAVKECREETGMRAIAIVGWLRPARGLTLLRGHGGLIGTGGD
jgi:hypothetical protein